MIALTKARVDPQTKAYIERKRAEGKTKREALRCLKRHLARKGSRSLIDASFRHPIRMSSMPEFPGGLDIGASNLASCARSTRTGNEATSALGTGPPRKPSS
jgi:hypothetical protein